MVPHGSELKYADPGSLSKRHFLAALFWGCSGFKLDSWWLCGHGGLGWMKG
jgi:hypothetical protein